jgi:hypothetical protein
MGTMEKTAGEIDYPHYFNEFETVFVNEGNAENQSQKYVDQTASIVHNAA